MSGWPASKASRVLNALRKIGWSIKRSKGSHRTLSRSGWADHVFAFHDGDEIGPVMLAKIAKKTGLTSRRPLIAAPQGEPEQAQIVILARSGQYWCCTSVTGASVEEEAMVTESERREIPRAHTTGDLT